MGETKTDKEAVQELSRLAFTLGWNMDCASVRRTSSRACLTVEHGDYNGTKLFGIDTDRFIWMAYKARDDNMVRLFSGNFSDDGVIGYTLKEAPDPMSARDTWARFPYGIDLSAREPVLQIGDESFTHQKISMDRGMDAVVLGNIPAGGMSRSASLSVNLLSSLLDVNGVELKDHFELCTMARAAEHSFGSTCGILDQVMIAYAEEGHGTLYDPATDDVEHIPFGGDPTSFSFVVMDTGTERPGLENARYVIRQRECWDLGGMLGSMGYKAEDGTPIGRKTLAQLQPDDYHDIMAKYSDSLLAPYLKRLKYVFEANQRFPQMIEAWKAGMISRVGAIFRKDGIGLRDDYELSWKEADTMCDIARSVPGVYGERMLGGGDAGAAGAIAESRAAADLSDTIVAAYPLAHPDKKDFAVYDTQMTSGNTVLDMRL